MSNVPGKAQDFLCARHDELSLTAIFTTALCRMSHIVGSGGVGGKGMKNPMNLVHPLFNHKYRYSTAFFKLGLSIIRELPTLLVTLEYENRVM